MSDLEKELRVQHHEKEIARSRIPRLILRPHLPQQQHKVSPASESPFSEEESREFNPSSSGRSARTVSSNSFCSDDTGCPSSQSVSPVKTPSDAGNSPIGFCPGSDEDCTRKKCTIGMVGEGSLQSARHKKEPKSGLVKPAHRVRCVSRAQSTLVNLNSKGSEADFSSSSSTGSISAPEVPMSAAGSKRSSFSRNRGPHGRSNGASSYKSANSPPSPREKDLLAMLCRNQLSPVNIHPSYAPSSPSSSNSGSYKGSDCSPVMRRSGRYMSCGENHGVKPPNPEQYLTPLQQKEVTVRHLKTKLKESERRLHERESEIVELKSQLARMREDWIEEECHRVEAQLALKEARKEIKQLKQVIETMRSSLADKDKGIQKYFVDINIQNKKLESLLQSMEMAHSGLLRDELCLDFPCESPEKGLALGAALGPTEDALSPEEPATEEGADSELLGADGAAPGEDVLEELVTGAIPEPELPGAEDPWPSSSAATPDEESGDDSTESFPEPISTFVVDLTPRNPNSAILLSPVETPSPAAGPEARGIAGRYWSRSFLVDLLAVGAPVVPTVLWAFSTQRGGTDPLYNIGALLRGCCVVALHSLRRTTEHIKT
ncbi:hypothetical protein E5288_WYG013356 [Bos mutus]|uniref:Syntabulin n=1 Tax=Bos mutus TaxID=72004 RepID=A0A6B0S0M6_9CETA|nr:hypothetical protein [Bos mutus]